MFKADEAFIRGCYKVGDLMKRIAIAATASPPDSDKFRRGIEVLRRAGFDLLYGDIFRSHLYLAGTDDERAAEFTSYLKDDSVYAILFARGGYGTQRAIRAMSSDISVGKKKKMIVGFSDHTPLLALLSSCGHDVYYGPVVTMIGEDKRTDDALFDLLKGGRPVAVPTTGVHIIKKGFARAPLAGGCLSLITSSLKTPYEIQFSSKILFIEDVNEKAYTVDRMLTQLLHSGSLDDVRGVMIGNFKLKSDEACLLEVVADRLSSIDGPVVAGMPFGHCHPFYPLPIGQNAILEARDGKVRLVFEGVR